ncbi:MAG: hypothetical protein JWO88_3835 [Frankiales bacterium]|nr:hypothetical protein [Frankiales bacterium]
MKWPTNLLSSAMHWGVAGSLAAALAAACGGGSSDAVGTAAGAHGATGLLQLALTDAPACGLDEVHVTIDKIRVHASSTAEASDPGWVDVSLGAGRRIDLLTLTNGALQELGAIELSPGRYGQVRMVLAPSGSADGVLANAVLPTGATSEVPLTISGDLSAGIRIPAGIEVVAGEKADFVLDFDACKSVARAGEGVYQLKPTISVVPRLAGGIQGVVAPALATGKTTVSAQQGGVAVRSTRPDADGKFSIPYLVAGTYTLVVTSDGHATGVVTEVPVQGGMTAVGTAAASVGLPISTMSELSGQLALADLSAPPGETGPAITDALVRAGQVLASGEAIEVRTLPVDGALATYRLSLPKAPLVRAGYAATGALSFVPDTNDAGRYSVEVLLAQ